MKPENILRFWSFSPQDILDQLKTSPEGLTESEARARIKIFKPGMIKAKRDIGSITMLLSQFKSPIILILIFAALFSIFLGDTTDADIILAIIFISGLLGFWQERGAANAVKKLLSIVRIKTRVLRNGEEREIGTEEIVPGDIIKLSAGSIIPGDALLLESHELFVDEAALTGETFPSEKTPGVINKDAPISQRMNSLFMGTSVISGSAKAVVVKTGINTEFGKVSEKLKLRPAETEFERGIRKFGYLLMEVTLVMIFVIFAFNVYLHKPVIDSFLFSLALAVGLTPTLLPLSLIHI